MGKKVNWSWTSALIGATTATAATTFFFIKPKVPSFRLVSLTALQLKFKNSINEGHSYSNEELNDKKKLPRLDADLILTIHVTNPNILPVRYSATSLSIYYDGSYLGSSHVPAGSQPPNSCQLLRLQARLNGQELAHHAKRFIGDVTKRAMAIHAEVDICGWAKMIMWAPKFKVHVDSRIIIDPVMLDVIDQENESRLQLFV
uniref:Water stress and hypersensitive response domain-containing protein n=1 Tax=Chenopodium quinoa TaxID=63459 RepID=A0A803MW27_CHEQI